MEVIRINMILKPDVTFVYMLIFLTVGLLSPFRNGKILFRRMQDLHLLNSSMKEGN